MMVLKRKEIVAAALVVLIGVAGYLNWSYQDTMRVSDNDVYMETGKKLGEARYVNAPVDETEKPENTEAPEREQTQSSADYFNDTKMQKEAARSKSIEILKQTAENESFDKEIREKAQNKILETAQYVEKETSIENIAKAKGYENIGVYYDGETVNISVKKAGFSEEDVVKLQEIAVSQLNIPAKNLKIVEVK
ncbi:MAG: SpoIIIAH-like family protein [Oscillospiraceae bacterium]|nr:SpoIIIAH-like family protein [Oscillospiraceae bacterium]